MLIKFISWNVNGVRALFKKPEWRWLVETDADIVGIQETKASPEQLPDAITNRDGWRIWWDSSVVRKGYSGVGVFSRLEPVKVTAQLPNPLYQGEGRLLHLEFPEFHFFNGYFPNGGALEVDEDGHATGHYKRVPFKLGFLKDFLELAQACQKQKPVVVCGDFNIACEAIDVANPDESVSGFLPEERAWMKNFIDAGFIDTFRHMHGPVPQQFTWWSYQGGSRRKNMGWRIDYFFVSRALGAAIRGAHIYADIKGSDHCPIGLELEL